ncbi:MAG: allantoate amidohydrolase [Rhodospirillaceae bacterium]|nr:allantoate amidohydrolase [Rhodospirillaceae bacterium]
MMSNNLPSIIEMIETLALISEDKDFLTRRYLTSQHKKVNQLVADWMSVAGMKAWQDPIGNIVGRYEGHENGLPALMLGSHLDTVVNAGKYDGMLGVVTAIHCVASLQRQGKRLPFAVEVIGFADEEGTRFKSTYLGSKAVAGTFDLDTLDRLDSDGISMKEALNTFGLDIKNIPQAARSKNEIAAYVELHIEQGPVLEDKNLAAGIVTEIAGATRLSVEIVGKAGHAGTVPLNLRQDALVTASECIVKLEKIAKASANTVVTVGEILIKPGASNVIPGNAQFTVDLRSTENSVRTKVENEIQQALQEICTKRKTKLITTKTHSAESTICSKNVINQLDDAFVKSGHPTYFLPSGAGHDTAAMSDLTETGMIFLRCREGISHNPAESVKMGDIEVGFQIMLKFIENFKPL